MAELIERATLTARDEDSGTRLVQCSFAGGYQRSKLEHVEPYGFTSEPFKDGETDAVVVNLNENKSHSLVVMINDHRYRLTSLQDGEVCMYDNKQRHVYLKSDGIEIDGVNDPVTVKTMGDIKAISGANIEVTASQNIKLNAGGKIEILAGGEVVIQGANVNIN